MRKVFAILIVLSFVPAVAMAGLSSKGAAYVGGTVPGVKEGAEGRFDTTGDTALIFSVRDGAAVSIPYAAISELEYGQKAGRRVGVAVMVSPLALFSKKRKHYLTISYKDVDGKDQAAVFELGKDVVRTTLKIVETRSGKTVTFQDEEARKSLGGGK